MKAIAITRPPTPLGKKPPWAQRLLTVASGRRCRRTASSRRIRSCRNEQHDGEPNSISPNALTLMMALITEEEAASRDLRAAAGH